MIDYENDCIDCGSDHMMQHYFGEGYMVRFDLWFEYVTPSEREHLICMPCFEKRLGRKLTLFDFTDCVLNDMNKHIQKLRNEAKLSKRHK